MVLCCAFAFAAPAKSLLDRLEDLIHGDHDHGSSSSSLVQDVYMKAQSCSAVVFKESEAIGTATVKTSKASRSVFEKKAKFKLTVAVELFSGKKYTASEHVSFKTDKDSDESFAVEDTLEFKSPLGRMPFEFGYDRDLGIYLVARNSSYSIVTSKSTKESTFDAEAFTFSAELTEIPFFGREFDMLDIFPEDEPIHVKRHRTWTFDRSPTIKYRKRKSDGSTWYELVGLDDERKSNLSALKLTYSFKTGMFKGSFYVYASNADHTEKAPKIKKYRANVKGVLVDEEGFGEATLKIGHDTYHWPVTITPSY